MKKQRTLSLFLVLLALCLTAFPAAAESVESATAATMQLMKTEGTVSVTNSTGRGLTARDNMRLYNGYHVASEAMSYAWINLDSEKLAKLDEVSEAEVRKSGKLLEILLSEGNLYFNVTSPLESDEALNIRTSTMAVGIRGTSGWVKVLDRWTTEVYILEGTVEVSVTDPVTNQTKRTTIRGGDKAVTVVYPQTREGDRCDIIQGGYGSGDIDGFVLVELAEDPGLCGDIYEETGMDPLPPMGVLESVRRQLDDIRDELNDVREQLQGENPSVEDAQGRLDDLQKRLEDVKSRLEGLGPEDDTQRRLNDAQEHLEQAQEVLNDASAAQQQGGDTRSQLQDALDRLNDAREDLEGAHQRQTTGSRQKAGETARKQLEQDQQAMQDVLERAETGAAGQDRNISTEPVWQDDSSTPGTPGSSGTTRPPQENVFHVTSEDELREAFRRADDGTLIVLDADIGVERPEDIGLSAGTAEDPVVLDLNGHDININSGSDINVTGGALTVRDSAEPGGAALSTNGTIRARDGAALSLDSGSINGTADYNTCVSAMDGSTFTMNGGSVNGTGSNTQAVYVGGGSTFVMNDGTVTDSGASYAVNVTGNSAFTMNGGTVDGGANRAVNCKASTFTISDGTVTSSNGFATVYISGGSLARTGGTITNRGTGVEVYTES